VLLLATSNAVAQSQPGPGLVGLSGSYANGVEEAAANANQATFNALDESCNPGGVFDSIATPGAPPIGTGCEDQNVFNAYLTVRELVHTANELQGTGPTVASLRTDQEGLGTALRWTAAEELAAQGSAASEFANSQLSNLASRLNALRFGARGFSVALNNGDGTAEGIYAANYGAAHGAGASADQDGATYSSWGGFLNGSFGWGKKKDTDLEDAFDFDGTDVTLGVDYRFRNNFVFGGLVGYKDQTIDFDKTASAIRVVDGGIGIEGTSAILFGLFQGEKAYASGSVGFEQIDYSVDRRIKYGSNNPDVGSANSIALSSPQADIVLATFNAAYALNKGRFTFEPYVKINYMDVTIDAFDEDPSVTPQGNLDSNSFDLRVAEQSFDSLDGVVGLKLQYTFTPKFGVIVPYAKVESHSELSRTSREISAGYNSLDDFGSGNSPLTFRVDTDEVDENWYTWAVGFSMVLRGGRQRTYDSPIYGGLMAFIQYESIEDLDNYEQAIVSGGFRYEF